MLSTLPESCSEDEEGQGQRHGGETANKLTRRGVSVTVGRSELSVSRMAYTEHSSEEDDRVYGASDFKPIRDFKKEKPNMSTRDSDFDEDNDDTLNMSGFRRTWDIHSALTDSQPLPPNTGWIRPEAPDAEYTFLGDSGDTRAGSSAVRRSSCTDLDSENDNDACEADTPPELNRRTWPAAPAQPHEDFNWSPRNRKLGGISMYSKLHFESSPPEELSDHGGIPTKTKMPPRKRQVEKEICKRRRCVAISYLTPCHTLSECIEAFSHSQFPSFLF